MTRLARHLLPAVALLALSGTGWAADEESLVLRFDPFERPDLDALARAADSYQGQSSSDSWQPVLNATLDSGDESFASLGGVVLRIGEETHGYRLLEVRLWEAVFERNGANVTLSVDAPAAQAARP